LKRNEAAKKQINLLLVYVSFVVMVLVLTTNLFVSLPLHSFSNQIKSDI